MWGPIGRAKNVCRHEISSRAEDTRASRKGPLDGAKDLPSFSAGMVDPTQSSRDVPVNLTLQLTRREILSVIKVEHAGVASQSRMCGSESRYERRSIK